VDSKESLFGFCQGFESFQGAKMDSNRRVPSHPRDNDIVTSLNAPLHANLILQSGILEVTVYNPAFSARNMDQ